MSHVLEVSVVIPTKNRPSDLRAAVASLLRQTHLPLELLIVDQSTGDESRRAVEQAFAEAPADAASGVALVYIHDPAIPGGAVARNRAMDDARGDVWLFLDDDVVLERDFIQEICRVYESEPDVTGVSGIVANYVPGRGIARAWNALFVRGPFRDPRQPIYHSADRLRDSRPVRVDRFSGGLMSFRTAAIRTHRFDPNLRGVSDGEDVDFCLRLGPTATLLLTPRARLVHNSSPIGRETAHHLRRDARALSYLYNRNWRRGVRNRLAYEWLLCGFSLLALLGSIRRRSLAPFEALLAGIGDAKEVLRSVGYPPGQRKTEMR